MWKCQFDKNLEPHATESYSTSPHTPHATAESSGRQPPVLFCRLACSGHASKIGKAPVLPPAPAVEPPTQPVPVIVTSPTQIRPQKWIVLRRPKSMPQVHQFLGSMLQKGLEQQRFHLDLTRAFPSCNIPLEKLGHQEMKDFSTKICLIIHWYIRQLPWYMAVQNGSHKACSN